MIDKLDETLREQVVAPLGIYNREKNADFFRLRELPENAPKQLNLVAFDTDGQCIGVKDFAPSHPVQIASR